MADRRSSRASRLARATAFVLGLLALVGAAAALAAEPAIAQPGLFLAQQRCSDGMLEVAEPGCPGAAPQRAADSMRMRRHDWPGPDGYQIEDSVLADDGASYVTTMSFAPFGRFDASHGDGGEVYVVERGRVRIAITQDGGQMGVVQGFLGHECGGTGWILFDQDAPSGHWADMVAKLKGRPAGAACLATSHAYTRYRLQTVSVPFLIRGASTAISRPTIISEHFNAATLARSTAMERFFLMQGVGRVIWEVWSRGDAGGPPPSDLARRCPGTAWSTPPAPGWRLSDCRYATNLRPAGGSLSVDAYGWPPRGLTLP